MLDDYNNELFDLHSRICQSSDPVDSVNANETEDSAEVTEEKGKENARVSCTSSSAYMRTNLTLFIQVLHRRDCH